MRPYPLALQLYSVREQINGDFPGMLARVADMGYAGVEFAGFQGHSAAELRTILDDLGLVTCSAHGAFPAEDNLSQLIDEANSLGYTHHVSGFGGDQLATREMTSEAACRAQGAAELLAGSGITFALHNHWWEFEPTFDGRTPHQILMAEAPDVFAEVDTYWVQVGGRDPVAVVAELGPRAPLLHIKDGPADREQPMTAVGAGVLDWEAIVGAANPATEWLIVELDRCGTDMLEAVAQSARYLIDNGFAKGRD